MLRYMYVRHPSNYGSWVEGFVHFLPPSCSQVDEEMFTLFEEGRHKWCSNLLESSLHSLHSFQQQLHSLSSSTTLNKVCSVDRIT